MFRVATLLVALATVSVRAADAPHRIHARELVDRAVAGDPEIAEVEIQA